MDVYPHPKPSRAYFVGAGGLLVVAAARGDLRHLVTAFRPQQTRAERTFEEATVRYLEGKGVRFRTAVRRAVLRAYYK
jgi:hypothetical protein